MTSVSRNHQTPAKGKSGIRLDKRAVSEAERDLVFAVTPKLMAGRLGISASNLYKQVTPKADQLPGDEYETERRSYAQSFATLIDVAMRTGHEDEARALLAAIASQYGLDVVDEDVLEQERRVARDEVFAALKTATLDEVREIRRAAARQGELFDSPAGPRGLAIAGDRN